MPQEARPECLNKPTAAERLALAAAELAMSAYSDNAKLGLLARAFGDPCYGGTQHGPVGTDDLPGQLGHGGLRTRPQRRGFSVKPRGPQEQTADHLHGVALAAS